MIAGFIFLRLRGILGRRTGHEENLDTNFSHEQLIEKHPKYVKWSGKTKKIDGIEMKKVKVRWGQAYKDSQK